ncbi:argininosuccinate lyase [Rubrivirga sp. S365]|uniref:Argininosuccinate lyase n=1 Tax=Rubrivirga litoralis TaxID=3075598 RepID=A0ABU3BPH7_9BACT|nr:MULTISPECIES: argininosuccinate lyase [unclassified Rubrivirga]MDT0631116.1 argininosuccinate lyase [Rubrivirga sp. F394]MDT7855371.1 argininosuccinate lyase [Rubrivirga sp. S365]
MNSDRTAYPVPRTPIWHKGTAADDWIVRFTVGEDWRWDTVLLPYDLEGTRAHAWALAQIGVLTDEEEAEVGAALDAIRGAWEAGEVAVRPEDEDMHTVIERELTERLGAAGKKIHAGRSRNDQVLTALRLWLRDALAAVAGGVAQVADALLDHAERGGRLLMPGYTHGQRAMPTTVAVWAAGYADLLADDLRTLAEARRAANTSPWGSAAGYGVPVLDLPRAAVAERLGFDRVQEVAAVQLSRGKLEGGVAHALVQVGLTLNRLASDLALFATAEFRFVRLPVEHTTGSSIMPQKRNPDVLELARATVHRLTAELHVLLGLPANLPGGYHRDLQLTKEATMRAVGAAQDVASAVAAVLPGVEWQADRMRAALSPDLFATAEALRRVEGGAAFRDAYREVGTHLDDLTVPSDADALAAYASPGTPGHVDVAALRDRLDAARAPF